MTGDSESELEGAGADPAPTPTEPSAAGEGDRTYHPRPFRSWASAQEEERGPSVWSRIGKRISGMFTKGESEPETPAAESDTTAAEPQIEALELEAESVQLEAAPVPADQDLQWIVPDASAEIAPDEELELPPEAPASAQPEEPPTIESIESEPVVMWTPEGLSTELPSTEDAEPVARSLLDEPSESEPGPVAHSLLDEPSESEPGPVARSLLDDEPEAEVGALELEPPEPPEPPKRPSLIARLFGRKSRPAEAAEPAPFDAIAESGTLSLPLDALPQVEGSTVSLPLDALPQVEGSTVSLPLDALPQFEGSTVSLPLDALPQAEPSTVALPIDALPLVGEPASEELAPADMPVSDAVGSFATSELEPEPSVEDPSIEEPEGFEPHEAPPEPPEELEPPKRGFFARMFGRKRAPVAVDVAANESLSEAPVVESAVAEEALSQEPMFEAPVLEEPVADDAPAQPALLDASIEDEEIIRTNEYPVEAAPETDAEAGVASDTDGAFASVDEALPVADETETLDLLEPVRSVPVSEPKTGFFSRLFGRKSKPATRPSLEIEVHEDRIEAAAHALDEVSGESFSSSQASSAAVEETFASVEDALPSLEPEQDAASIPSLDDALPLDVPPQPSVPGLDDQRFAPPPPAPEPVAMQESRSTLEIEPFDPFGERESPSRDTLEVGEESRSTIEMQQEARSTVEVEQDFGDTLEIDEKTDEFEVPVPEDVAEGAAGDVDDGPDTLEVPKQSWLAKLFGIGKKEDKAAEVGTTAVEGNPNFLFSKFRAFYNEIIRFKHQKTEFTAGFSTAIVTDYAADLSPDASADNQSKALAQMLELQMAEANWMGGEAKDRYPDAQYAMAALADEIFTHLEWEGQAAWPKHLIEVKLYRTHAADVELFRRIDKLLKDKPNSPVARDLARVYLLVIAAGFQGKYRPFGLTRALADYRQRLYEYIHNDDPLMLYAPERKIFPDAASRTIEGHAVSRFTAAQRWAAILVFLLVGYTVLAHFAWNRVSADLKDVTARIRTAGATAGPGSTAPSATTSNASGGGAR